jgi:NADH:ubiquinone oxidoreductase subunit 6 (subunit J)
MEITLRQLMFAAIAFIVLGSAVMAVTLRNLFHCLLFLALGFLGIAGVYLLLSADFLAAIQILVYIGAITMLIMFALMLTHRVMTRNIVQSVGQWWLALPVSIGILAVLFRVFVNHPWAYAELPAQPTTGIIGRALLTKYVLPFELASIVLLVAMIGAIVLAKEDKPDDPA